MKTIYVLTAWNPKRHGCNIVPFKSIKKLSAYIDELAINGFTEFLMEKRRVSR
jgi:hypothetical protein